MSTEPAVIRCATANVRTLLPHQESCSYAQVAGTLVLSKVRLLEMQFAEAGIDFAGIQEGRSRHTQERSGISFDMITAAASAKGAHGVQLWIRRALKCKLQQWKAISPRLLFAVVDITACGARLGIIV